MNSLAQVIHLVLAASSTNVTIQTVGLFFCSVAFSGFFASKPGGETSRNNALAVVADGEQILDDIGGLVVVLGSDGRGDGIQHVGEELLGILQVRNIVKYSRKILGKFSKTKHTCCW